MNEDERTLFGIDRLNVPRSHIPAVTHNDYSARVQTVHFETNPRYHTLLSRFKQRTVSRNRKYLLQCTWRVHRVHPRGRLPLLHGYGDRNAGGWGLPPEERGTGSDPQAKLQGHL